MTRTGPLSRRRVLIFTAVTLAVLTVGLTGRFLADPSSPALSAGVREAATYADGPLLSQLEEIADESGDRYSGVAAALKEAHGPLADLYPYAVTVTGEGERDISAAIYYLFQNQGFSEAFWGGPYWGRVCRTYTVTEVAITAQLSKCGPNVSDTPPPGGIRP